MKKYTKIIFVFLLMVFVYFRIGPVLNRTVPYTYDQGRDFLKADEMITNMRPVFIGPTTGIDGIFHGAWWYYLLLIPRILFNGDPIGFYYLMLFLSAAVNLWFFFFVRKRLGDLSALLFLAIISISPYFISTSFSTSNNIIVPYLMLSLIGIIFLLFEKKVNNKVFFALGLVLSFMFEFEVAFGLFIIPVFFITSAVFTKIRQQLFKLNHLIFLISGLLIPLVPRLLFEIKNNFLQTRTLLGFVTNPKLHNPQSFNMIVDHRIALLSDYMKGLMFQSSIGLVVMITLFTLFVLIYLHKSNRFRDVVNYLTLLLIMLISLSFFYKDNFWFNYFESIHYVFLTLILLAASTLNNKNRFFTYLVLLIFLTLNVYAVSKDIVTKKSPEVIGLSAAESTFDYIHGQVGKDDFCLRIYTPPVIPHTYVYLMNYKARTQDYKISSYDFKNNLCYFIIESDPYSFRIDKWREDNTPEEAELVEKKAITKSITVETWGVK